MSPTLPKPLHSTLRPVSMLAIGLALALLAALLTTAPQARAAAELVANPSFANGTTSWRTNGAEQMLSTVPAASGRAGQLTTTKTHHAVLNDASNTVQGAAAGSSFSVTAKVRTTTPGVTGALRVREVGGGTARSHQTWISLPTTQWQTVTLDVTTNIPAADLDLNVVAWSLKPDENLLIDSVSLRSGESTGPAPSPAPAPPPGDQCDGTVPNGTLFGSSISLVNKSIDQTLADVDGAFGRVPVIRDFSRGLPRSWSSHHASALRGRTLVTSFRASPQSILSGQHDAFFRTWFASAPDDQTIYWSYYHEPEPRIDDGVYSASQYRAAWRHLDDLADETCTPNMFSTLILTGWTANPKSGRSISTYDAGPDTIDVIAYDPYNGIHDPNRTYYDSPANMFGHIVDFHERDGRPFGIAETGSRLISGDSGTDRAAWVRSMGAYLKRNDAAFVSYFQSTRGAHWRLDDRASRGAWAALVQ